MELQDEQYNVASIYGALMRPPMYKGVPLDFIPIAFIVVALLTVGFNPIVGVVSLLPLWLVGYVMGKADPDGLSVFRMYYQSRAKERRLTRGDPLTTYGAF